MIKDIQVIKEGRDVEEWGGGWLVDITFDKEMHRCLNKVDDKMIDNDNMVLKAIAELVNLQLDWLDKTDEQKTDEAENGV